MNNFEQFLINELSKGLYKRAADKANELGREADDISGGHAAWGQFSGGDTRKHHWDISNKSAAIGNLRREQGGKFSAAAKGAKSRRPARGFPLGPLQRTMRKKDDETRKAMGAPPREKPNLGKPKGKTFDPDQDNDPADYWKNESFINELSKDLYKRAKKSADKRAHKMDVMKRVHAFQAIKKGEAKHDTPIGSDPSKWGLNTKVSMMAHRMGDERREQSSKFHLASKGIKTRRPGRIARHWGEVEKKEDEPKSFPLGPIDRHVKATSKKLYKRSDWEGLFNQQDESTINNFQKYLIDVLLEARGDQIFKGLGYQSATEMGSRVVEPGSIEGQIRQIGKSPWKGARAFKAPPRTRRASEKRVSTIKKIYRSGSRTRALPGSSIEPFVQKAASALRDARKKKQKMEADLEGGSPTLKQSWTT